MIPTRIGQVLRGGTFTGFNRVRNSVYSIIVAPKSTEAVLAQKPLASASTCTQSSIDGFSNTAAMNDVTHPAAYYCKNLNVDGIAEWHLPSKNELELCYRYLKPTRHTNYEYPKNYLSGNLSPANGTNLSSVPVGIPYTKTSPAQTIVTQFLFKSRETFNSWYWTSTESSSLTTLSLIQVFSSGNQVWGNKTFTYKVRGVRGVLIAQKQEKHY